MVRTAFLQRGVHCELAPHGFDAVRATWRSAKAFAYRGFHLIAGAPTNTTSRLRVSVRKQTKPRSEVEVAKGSRSLLLCDARISVFHVSDGAAKKSAQAWLIRGGLG